MLKYEIVVSKFWNVSALVGIDVPFRITPDGTIQLSGEYKADQLIEISKLANKHAAQHSVHPTRGSVAQKVSSKSKGSVKPARG